ncbi:MAG: HdeD family acid-resistance protein [Nitrososphaeraceae archaeon]
MSDLKAPGWVRAAQIGLGALAIILAITLLVIPGAVLTSIIFLVGILLLIVGIESVISGMFVKSKSRMASIGLGILVIILSLIVIAFPAAVGVFLLILIGIVLLIDGISRLVHGFGDKEHRGWSRGFRIGVGALEIVLGILIMVSPGFGAAFVGIIIAIAVLIVGIQMIVAGFTGRRMRMMPTSSGRS